MPGGFCPAAWGRFPSARLGPDEPRGVGGCLTDRNAPGVGTPAAAKRSAAAVLVSRRPVRGGLANPHPN